MRGTHDSNGQLDVEHVMSGVVAIAITVLILPLVDVVSDIRNMKTAEFLAQNQYRLFIFVLSFAVIANFWVMHHQIYERVSSYTIPLVWANMLWLLSIVSLPFSTNSSRHSAKTTRQRTRCTSARCFSRVSPGFSSRSSS